VHINVRSINVHLLTYINIETLPKWTNLQCSRSDRTPKLLEEFLKTCVFPRLFTPSTHSKSSRREDSVTYQTTVLNVTNLATSQLVVERYDWPTVEPCCPMALVVWVCQLIDTERSCYQEDCITEEGADGTALRELCLVGLEQLLVVLRLSSVPGVWFLSVWSKKRDKGFP